MSKQEPLWAAKASILNCKFWQVCLYYYIKLYSRFHGLTLSEPTLKHHPKFRKSYKISCKIPLLQIWENESNYKWDMSLTIGNLGKIWDWSVWDFNLRRCAFLCKVCHRSVSEARISSFCEGGGPASAGEGELERGGAWESWFSNSPTWFHFNSYFNYFTREDLNFHF